MTDNSNMIEHLKLGQKEFLIVGTAHVSKESTDLVKATIEEEQPDTVCVELCDSRYQSIRHKNRWQDMNINKVIKEKKTFLLLSNLLLASFQKRIADKLDIQPGAEMIQAIDSADARIKYCHPDIKRYALNQVCSAVHLRAQHPG